MYVRRRVDPDAVDFNESCDLIDQPLEEAIGFVPPRCARLPRQPTASSIARVAEGSDSTSAAKRSRAPVAARSATGTQSSSITSTATPGSPEEGRAPVRAAEIAAQFIGRVNARTGSPAGPAARNAQRRVQQGCCVWSATAAGLPTSYPRTARLAMEVNTSSHRPSVRQSLLPASAKPDELGAPTRPERAAVGAKYGCEGSSSIEAVSVPSQRLRDRQRAGSHRLITTASVVPSSYRGCPVPHVRAQ